VPFFGEKPRFGDSIESDVPSGRARECYYFHPERGPNAPPHPSEQVGAVGSRAGLKVVAPTPQQLSLARGRMIQYNVRATRNGTYRWTVIAPRMSASVVVEGEHNVVDSVRVGDAGGHFQEIQVSLPNSTRSRRIGMAVSGWPGQDRQLMRHFVVE